MKNRIKLLRKDLKLTQKAFGSTISLSCSQIACYENGTRSLTERALNDICRVFNVNENWLKYGIGNMYSDLSNEDEIKNLINDFISDNNMIKKDIINSLLKIHDENTLKLIFDIIHKFSECEIYKK